MRECSNKFQNPSRSVSQPFSPRKIFFMMVMAPNPLYAPEVGIVETTFVVSRFSDIRKETTSFLVVPKKSNQERRSFSVGSDNYTKYTDNI